MTELNPTPACLSHLTQRDAAVRAMAIEEAYEIACRVVDQYQHADVLELQDDILGALKDAITTPPAAAPAPDEARGPHNACGAAPCNQPENCNREGECHYTKSPFWQPRKTPAPDEAAIRAELVAALRALLANLYSVSSDVLEDWTMDGDERAKIALRCFAAIALAEATPGAST